MSILDRFVGIHPLERNSLAAIFDQNGDKVRPGDYVAVMVPIVDEYGHRAYHFKGKGRVERIVYLPKSVEEYKAEVQYLAWLTPDWFSGREFCSGAWLRLIDKAVPKDE